MSVIKRQQMQHANCLYHLASSYRMSQQQIEVRVKDQRENEDTAVDVNIHLQVSFDLMECDLQVFHSSTCQVVSSPRSLW